MTDTQSPDPTGSIQPDPSTRKASLGDKVKTGAYIAKCVIIGGLFLVAGIIALVSAPDAWWAGLIGIVYGVWVLSGVATGGWRLFIY